MQFTLIFFYQFFVFISEFRAEVAFDHMQAVVDAVKCLLQIMVAAVIWQCARGFQQMVRKKKELEDDFFMEER